MCSAQKVVVNEESSSNGHVSSEVLLAVIPRPVVSSVLSCDLDMCVKSLLLKLAHSADATTDQIATMRQGSHAEQSGLQGKLSPFKENTFH